MRGILLGIGLAAICGAAQASPFAIRYAGSNTAIVVDQGSIGRSGAARVAWTYIFFRSNRLMTPRLEILATHEAVNCRTQREKALASVDYLASGVVLSKTGPDAAWSSHLRGSNIDLIMTTLCEGATPPWVVLRLPNVFAAYKAVWR
jgi:hypothetical protein